MMYQKTLRIPFALAILIISAAAVAGNKLPLNDTEKDWLNTVETIITHKEKKTFKKELRSHQDREAFIDLFWKKRDPDLTTEVNEFKDGYLSRYQEVQENHFAYDNGRFNAFTMADLFLMLGEPDRRFLGLDHRIMGFHSQYRTYTRTLRRSPEVWEYKEPGYGYPTKSLVVQFIATSSTGDYVALSDSLTERFLNNLRQKLIVNPQLETAVPQS